MKLLFLFMLVILCTAISAFAGNELGNGGDLVSQEFIAAGRKLVTQLREKPDSRIPDVNRLADAVEQVKVTSSGALTLHGAEVDAINYPEEREIDVNRPRWQSADPEKRASLVLHEYLGILQVNDLHYEISGSYAQPFAAPEEKEKRFEVGVGSSFGWEQPFSSDKMRTSSPGTDARFGVLLGSRSELLAQFNRQTFSDSPSDEFNYSHTYTEVTLGFKYWLSQSRVLRPYLQANAGYGWRKSTASDAYSTDPWGEKLYYKWDSTPTGNFDLQLGAGARYSLLRDVGLDFGLTLHDYGTPWDWQRMYQKTLVGNAGVDVLF